MPPDVPEDLEDLDPGLARERTRLAWARTAIAFAAVGGAMLKRELIPGAIVLALTPLVWALGRLASRAAQPEPRPGRMLAVVIALIGHSPVSLRQLLHG